MNDHGYVLIRIHNIKYGVEQNQGPLINTNYDMYNIIIKNKTSQRAELIAWKCYLVSI